MIGRNSGIRSIGDSTQSPATATATLTRRGTRGSLRNRRAVVTQAGSTVARSLARPGGSRLARTIISIQETVMTTTAMINQCHNMYSLNVTSVTCHRVSIVAMSGWF